MVVDSAVVSGRLAERMEHVERAREFLASLGPAHPALTYEPVEVAFGVERPHTAQDAAQAVRRGR